MIKRELKKWTLKKDKYIALSNLRIYSTWKNIKKSYKNNRFKISAPRWKEEFELPDGHVLFQIFKIILNLYQKSMGKRQLILQ